MRVNAGLACSTHEENDKCVHKFGRNSEGKMEVGI
jgi:hypothetical protein